MSSDDDSEYIESSPIEVPVVRRGNRRKAHTPSPRKVPKKKQKYREALTDFNVDVEDSDEEVHDKRKNGHGGTAITPQGKTHKSATNDSSDEESGGTSGGVSDELENRPPASTNAVVNADIPEESSQPVNNADGQTRTRKRLSIRSEGTSSSDHRSSVTSGAESMITTASEVQTIYATCSQMFTANKINANNAFNLRLLDCINQMINSPTYDKSNMQLTSSTVEIGTKIYVCRVDNAHSQVLSLASEISLQQRRKQKDGTNTEQGDVERGDMIVDNVDDLHDDAPRQKQKRKPAKRRGKYVEEDNAKLSTGLEEQNVKYVTRRNILKKKFNEMIYDDLDFDYMSYFLESEDVHPLQTENEKQKIKSSLRIPESYINSIEMGRLDFLPFHYLSKYDPETHNVWGRPLNTAEDLREDISEGPNLPINDEFAYDPANRPAEYPDDAEADNIMDATLGDAMAFDEDGEGGLRPVSFHDIQSLDHLDNYFQRVKGLLKESRSKFGWCGPNFVRPKPTWPVKQGPRKAKSKKDPERIDFTKMDWNDKSNKFNTNFSARTVHDDRIIESWSSKKVIIPYLGIELVSFEEDFDPLDYENEEDPKYIPPIFKLFTNRKRSILDLLKSQSARRRNLSGVSSDPPNLGDDDGFDNDIELPRDIAEDFCSQPVNENEEGYPQTGCSAPTEAGWQFPSSMPGDLLNEDPLSRVSDIDSIRFSRKPKPINMSALKKAILKTLINELVLDENGIPIREEESRIPLSNLMFKVLQTIDSKTEMLLSVSIFVVALMHVVAEKRLFVMYDDSDPDCPNVICRGKDFNHKDHIPIPGGSGLS